jgi:hypothetical protein
MIVSLLDYSPTVNEQSVWFIVSRTSRKVVAADHNFVVLRSFASSRDFQLSYVLRITFFDAYPCRQ